MQSDIFRRENSIKLTATSRRLPQWGLTWLNQVQCLYQHFCLIASEVLYPYVWVPQEHISFKR